jgi:hypothetical protein
MLLWIHPIVQTATLVLALYVFRLGLARFASRHLGRSTPFRWNRHVTLGKAVVLVWAAGAVGGIGVTWVFFGKVFPGSTHFQVGLLMLPVLLVTWSTGNLMNRHRNRYRALPVVHVANNVLLLGLAFSQLFTGLGMVWRFVIGD